MSLFTFLQQETGQIPVVILSQNGGLHLALCSLIHPLSTLTEDNRPSPCLWGSGVRIWEPETDPSCCPKGTEQVSGSVPSTWGVSMWWDSRGVIQDQLVQTSLPSLNNSNRWQVALHLLPLWCPWVCFALCKNQKIAINDPPGLWVVNLEKGVAGRLAVCSSGHLADTIDKPGM